MRTIVAASIAIALAAVLAATAAAQVPTEDSVTGFASTGEGHLLVDFTFDAHSGPSGENPGGTVRFDALLIDLGDLEVSCLTVSGNRASMVLRIPPIPAAPAGILVSVEDNDGAGADGLSWDLVTLLPTDCPVPDLIGGPINGGDITVADAQPLPTSKDQCENGGWRSFGVFKNQGDCVSFVATGGKNQPG